MSADFVPFVQSLNAKVGSTTQPRAFSALPNGGGAVAGLHAHGGGEVKVELKREGDRVTQIRVQCRCGEVIELNCDYDAVA